MDRIRFKFYVIAFISCLAGLFVFTSTQYKQATLKIYIKTLDKGIQRISVKASGRKSSIPLTYETKDNEGFNCIYPIILPDVSIESIYIAPLTTKGMYEITRIDLQSDSKTFAWEDMSGCKETIRSDSSITSRPCGPEAPVLISNADLSINISCLTPLASENSLRLRVIISLLAMTLLFSQHG